MVIKLLLPILALIYSSQSISQTEFIDDRISITFEQVGPESISWKVAYLEMGDVTGISEDGTFVFECDCCMSEVYFTEQNNFFRQDICMGDFYLLYGKIVIKDSTLILNYDKTLISEENNREYQINDYSSVPENERPPHFSMK